VRSFKQISSDSGCGLCQHFVALAPHVLDKSIEQIGLTCSCRSIDEETCVLQLSTSVFFDFLLLDNFIPDQLVDLVLGMIVHDVDSVLLSHDNILAGDSISILEFSDSCSDFALVDF